jgi:hypothetical protein
MGAWQAGDSSKCLCMPCTAVCTMHTAGSFLTCQRRHSLEGSISSRVRHLQRRLQLPHHTRLAGVTCSRHHHCSASHMPLPATQPLPNAPVLDPLQIDTSYTPTARQQQMWAAYQQRVQAPSALGQALQGGGQTAPQSAESYAARRSRLGHRYWWHSAAGSAATAAAPRRAPRAAETAQRLSSPPADGSSSKAKSC